MRRRRKRRQRRRVVGILLLAFIFYFIKTQDISIIERIAESFTNSYSVKADMGIGGRKIYSETALLLSTNDGKVLYEKNKDEKIYPASLTKMMTTIVALENMVSLDDLVLITQDDFKDVYENGAAVAGFKAGEMVTKRDLLYGIMLPSGAEASNAISNSLGGSERFIGLMNDKARELGMEKTHFTNTTGLHDENHYTTAEDLGKLFRYALRNGDFRAIIAKEEYISEKTGLKMTSRVYDRLEKDRINGYKIIGGKTGYTDSAGLCLATACEKDGKEYILITTGAKGGPDSKQYNFLDSYYIYNNYL